MQKQSNAVFTSLTFAYRNWRFGMANGSRNPKENQLGLHNQVYGMTHKGLQLGAVNESRAIATHTQQYGLANVISQAKAGKVTQAGVLGNMLLEDQEPQETNSLEQAIATVQVGSINIAEKPINGLQAGFFCYAKEGNYIQLGLLTIREKADGKRRITPLIGYSQAEQKKSLQRPGWKTTIKDLMHHVVTTYNKTWYTS